MNKKKRLRSKADKLFALRVMELAAGKCEVCGSVAHTAHHFAPKGQYGHLRYYLPNGIPICNSCHYKHHFKFDPKIHGTIILRRGEKWYQDIVSRKRESPASYQTVGYYENVIKSLN